MSDLETAQEWARRARNLQAAIDAVTGKPSGYTIVQGRFGVLSSTGRTVNINPYHPDSKRYRRTVTYGPWIEVADAQTPTP